MILGGYGGLYRRLCVVVVVVVVLNEDTMTWTEGLQESSVPSNYEWPLGDFVSVRCCIFVAVSGACRVVSELSLSPQASKLDYLDYSPTWSLD